MSILIVYPHGNALNRRGGAETRVWSIVYSLISNNIDLSIFHSSNSKKFENKDLKKKCQVSYYKELYFLKTPDWYFTDFNPFFIIKLYKILRKHKFKIIQIEFPWGFLITKLLAKKNTFLIYDSHGVESEFINIAMKNPNFPNFLKPLSKLYSRLYEKVVCKIANLIINVSEVDRQYYVQNYNINRKKTFLIQIPSIAKKIESKGIEEVKLNIKRKLKLPLDRKIVLFHGTDTHPPNKEGFELIENYISPRIKDPQILFVLAGYNLKKFKKENIVSLGFVQNLTELLIIADLAIVPIISGSGMRVKCSDYISFGIPFITTGKGIEGIDFLEDRRDCIIFKEVDEKFIEAINDLSNNNKLRQLLHDNLIKKSELISFKSIERKIVKLYSKLISEINF